MQETTPIRILENDNNRRGDLFGRLMADLFVALGYEQPRLNIHKSGRELDLSAEHRLESRRAIAECKATAEPIGGGDLNKFVGVLDVEKDDRPITGYFISLSGFRETAVEQEKQRRTKIIMLTGAQVISELVRGRIIVASDRATERAGRHCALFDHLTLDPEAELLVHARGWIWVVYYAQGKNRTHFILIHSDGTPLASAIAKEVIEEDKNCGGVLHKLTCLNPAPPDADGDLHVGAALAAYLHYLENECGFIQLDGLPADSDIGSRRIRLETLFVPLHVDVPFGQGRRKPAGTVLSEHPRLALLAPPGGGKSTLLKRLAIAYADPTRRDLIKDYLPQRKLLPIFFRCRELRSLARGSFAELIETISQRDPVRQYSDVFCALVDRALLDGCVILLVDGLDEISDPGDRAAFVCTLRTALQAYPGIAIVVTSREAGFRHVAAHLAPVCTLTALSPFDENDIWHLCIAWHQEVVGDTEKVRADAEQLAVVITHNDRLKGLAINPLLLTTLLLVKRWVGSLPTRRSVLYGKAVEVLLMTWNTEGHDPMPEQETLPQLCYVAFAMMLEGVQKISRPRLAALLKQARNAMPTELGYVKGTVDEFIHRVEDRSSLLMMSGLDVEDGQLVEFFEFRHLTFQEFLTARGIVEGWQPDHHDTDTLVSVLEPHIDNEQWREVIPLAAVLGGKAAEDFIRWLTLNLSLRQGPDPSNKRMLFALVTCLADEAAARPETIRAAMREIVSRGTYLIDIAATPMLIRGRYGNDLCEEARYQFLKQKENRGHAAYVLLQIIKWLALERVRDGTYLQAVEYFIEMLNSPEELSRCEGALGLGWVFHDIKDTPIASRNNYSDPLKDVEQILGNMLDGTVAECCSASFAIEGLGDARIWTASAELDIIGKLYRLWRANIEPTLNDLSVRALVAQAIASPNNRPQSSPFPKMEIEQLLRPYYTHNSFTDKLNLLVIAWYTQVLNDAELKLRARALAEEYPENATDRYLVELLIHLEQISLE